MSGVAESRGRVGLIGIGALGLVVAERLIAGGRTVCGFRRGSLEAFVALGGTPASSAARVAASSDVVILLLPSDDALHAVMAQIGPDLRPRQSVLCLGTHRIDAKQRARDLARAAGAILIDGEVSGTPAMMRNGQASVMVAGDDGAVRAVRPLLDLLVKTVSDVGAFGNATKMKLVTNYLVGVHTLAAAEALFLAEHLGLDLHAVVETIGASAGSSTMFAVRGRTMVARDYAGHPMSGFLRFFELLREALPVGVTGAAPVLEVTERLYRRAVADGYGDKDIAAISADFTSHWRSAFPVASAT